MTGVRPPAGRGEPGVGEPTEHAPSVAGRRVRPRPRKGGGEADEIGRAPEGVT